VVVGASVVAGVLVVVGASVVAGVLVVVGDERLSAPSLVDALQAAAIEQEIRIQTNKGRFRNITAV